MTPRHEEKDLARGHVHGCVPKILYRVNSDGGAFVRDIGTRIYIEDGQYEVWIGPDSDLRDDNVINAFVAGVGDTRAEAVADAVRELEAVTALLQGPPAGIVEVPC